MFCLSLKVSFHFSKGQAQRDAFTYILSFIYIFSPNTSQDHFFKGTEIKTEFLQLKQT